MALTLSSEDVSRLVSLQTTLLSPLEHDGVDEWCAAVLPQAEALFGGDRSAFFLPLSEQLHYVSESLEPGHLAAFKDAIADMEPGAIRVADPVTDGVFSLRRTGSPEVWSIPMIARLGGMTLDDIPGYHDFVRPAGVTYGPVMSAAVPYGEALLGVSHSRMSEADFDEPRELALMRLLGPAFSGGTHTVVRLEGGWSTIARTVDELRQAVVVYDRGGRELHRSRRFAELVSDDPERARVVLEARRLADSLVRRRYRRQSPDPRPTGAKEVATASALYSIRATYAGRGLFGFHDAILVALERLTPQLPSAERLEERYGLTARQAEVALLLARGLPNAGIADRLGISPHTVRHHTEWVFSRLGIHSRSALAVHPLSDTL